jgi:hypothetical protein
VIHLTEGYEVEKPDHSPEPATAMQESRGGAGAWATEVELEAELAAKAKLM